MTHHHVAVPSSEETGGPSRENGQLEEDPGSPSENSPGEHLSRSLGLSDLVLLGIGASIGSGIFVVTGVVARDAGPGVVLSFAIAGLACVADALCYAELATRFPGRVGGAYLYAHAAFGELPAFLVFCNLMFDYHIGAASIARSLASYLVSLAEEIVPALEAWVPAILAPAGKALAGGYLSVNLVAPALLAGLTLVLCRGVRESATFNAVMTTTKVAIVILVVAAGSFKVDPANWVPFAPNGVSAIVTAASVVFFSYIGFDAVANSAEESKRPQRDLPIGIMASLGVCGVLYVAVCLVLTGMLPYSQLDPSAPLAAAFAARGMPAVEGLIGVGALVGLTTALLAGLYVQARLYMAVGRDGLLPHAFAAVDAKRHTPMRAQIFVGCVAIVLAALFDVGRLSHILSVGVLVSYTLVCMCVIALRLFPEGEGEGEGEGGRGSLAMGRWHEALACMTGVVVLSLALGAATRLGAPLWVPATCLILIVLCAAALLLRQSYSKAASFACPWIPVVPLLGVAINTYLVAQMHAEAWLRLAVVTLVAVVLYATYGRLHESGYSTGGGELVAYERAPVEEASPSRPQVSGSRSDSV
eukprot:jgi/Mesen1/9763/ME000007S09815